MNDSHRKGGDADSVNDSRGLKWPNNPGNWKTKSIYITPCHPILNPLVPTMKGTAILPRVSTILRLPRNQYSGEMCIRNVLVGSLPSRRSLHTTLPPQKLSPPMPPDISKHTGVDLNEFLGSSGWNLDELLPPSRPKSSTSPDATDDSSITPETLLHLLRLSGLPPPKSPQEESNLLSALHAQLHFVRHVQSVPTDDVKPLIRVGHEPHPEDEIGVLSYQECVEESQSENISGLEWKQWDICGLKGGSREGRDQGWFIVNGEPPKPEETEEVDE